MSQDYTPVAWVDETTSQQGTLINAERLNQMQTAHHYADGFEEVDEIPTEDPGTAYHKIVYCTEDSAFYRWDGTQWTADIDEETKHLLDQEIARAEHAEGLIQGYLDAHEANHNNPHAVTKAQVGLGNCDNTADTDKPISTAAQAALDTKADKATTLAGYGITDAYTKAQADTLLADKADKADVYDKTAADTLLAGKVDKLVSSPAGTYKSVTVNDQGQVTAGTNPDTLAGYGITDAYTKTEADTLLASKADTTALTDGSVTKVGTADVGTDTKPIKLVGGVPTAVTNDLVSTSGAQTVGGTKTFTTGLVQTSSNLDLHDTTKGYTEGGQRTLLSDKNGVWFNDNIIGQNGATTFKYDRLQCDDGNGGAITAGLRMILNPNTFTLATFKGSAQDNVVTASVLDGYAPMVRTTGNQSINGTKEFINPIKGQMFELARFGSNTTAGWYAIAKLPKTARELYLSCYSPGNMNFVLLETNTHVVNVIKWVGNYASNQNRFMWVETADNMILYIYSATYRTNILNLLNYSVYGTPVGLSEIDTSVFTGQPVAKPEVGGDITAVYDETLLNMVTTS